MHYFRSKEATLELNLPPVHAHGPTSVTCFPGFVFSAAPSVVSPVFWLMPVKTHRQRVCGKWHFGTKVCVRKSERTDLGTEEDPSLAETKIVNSRLNTRYRGIVRLLYTWRPGQNILFLLAWAKENKCLELFMPTKCKCLYMISGVHDTQPTYSRGAKMWSCRSGPHTWLLIFNMKAREKGRGTVEDQVTWRNQKFEDEFHKK